MNDFIDLLPPNMRRNGTVRQLAHVLDGEIAAVDALAEKLLIYSGLDNQNEDVIDELARSFHLLEAEGYKFADSPEKKRELVKSALTLHRHKGTLYAVKEVLSILNVKGKVLEWFEYGGKPYYFKIDANVTGGMGGDDIAVLEALLNEFKNVRSHLEGVAFNIMAEGRFCCAAAGLSGEVTTVMPYVPEIISAGQAIYYTGAAAVDEIIRVAPGKITEGL